MNRTLLSCLLFSISITWGYCQMNPKTYKQSKKIKLDLIVNKSVFVYENSVSIIYLDKSMVVNCIKKHLNNKRLCELRMINYNKILNHLLSSDSSVFVIEPALSPDILELFGGVPKIDTITGYIPLDYYANALKKDISLNYIPPYGYQIELDTLGKVHLSKYYGWMISDLALKGKAKIYNKQTMNYEKRIIYEYVNFEGHGGKDLLFQDRSSFFNIITYTDIGSPDYECGQEYEGYEIIE